MQIKQAVTLVTGGCGFVGRHLVQNLLADGREVWVLDNLLTGAHPDRWLPDFVKTESDGVVEYQRAGQRLVFLERDVVDFFRDELRGASLITVPFFSEVYHLAAVVGGRAVLIEEDPMLVAANHVIDSLFFQWAVKQRKKIGRILYASTSVGYPKTLQERGVNRAMKESFLDLQGGGTIGMPESIYGWVKLSGEYLAALAAERYGMSVACVRPFSGYGEDQDLSYPIPSIAARAAKREDPLFVWGSGEQGRDFVYIDDFVSALRVALRKISDGRAVNIGTGTLTTFKEVARIMAELEGYGPEVRGLTEKAEGSFAVWSDPALLKSFGWQPRISLREGFAKVLASVKEKHSDNR